MKSQLNIVFFILYSSLLFAHTPKSREIKDTIYLSQHTMTHLVFYEPILMADYGSSVIATVANAPKVTTINGTDIVSVKARKKFKIPTNITVITASNTYYTIHCLYSETSQINFYHYRNENTEDIEVTEAIHPDSMDEEVPVAARKDSAVTRDILRYYADTIRYKGIAKRLYGDTTKPLKNYFSRTKKITLQLTGIYALKDKLYVKVSIANGGVLPFQIQDWEFSIRKKGGYDVQQPSDHSIVPVYSHNQDHQVILPKRKLTKVFVFEPFSMDKSTSVYIRLSEQELQRMVILEIPSKYINKVTPITWL